MKEKIRLYFVLIEDWFPIIDFLDEEYESVCCIIIWLLVFC